MHSSKPKGMNVALRMRTSTVSLESHDATIDILQTQNAGRNISVSPRVHVQQSVKNSRQKVKVLQTEQREQFHSHERLPTAKGNSNYMIYKSNVNHHVIRDNVESQCSSTNKHETKEWMSTKLHQIESIKQQINSVIDITNELEQKRVYSKDNA